MLGVLREALYQLCQDPPESLEENAINRQLYFHLLRVNQRRQRNGEGPMAGSVPRWECPIQPTPQTVDTASEFKRPDFTWGFQDASAPMPERSVRDFVVECKRLGDPVSRSWNLNRNYVLNGILRFVDSKHSYGKDTSSGAMIGYVQTSSVSTIRDAVNDETSRSAIPALSHAASSEWEHTEHLQRLRREFEPTDFTLHHLWGDLRPDSLRVTEVAPAGSEVVGQAPMPRGDPPEAACSARRAPEAPLDQVRGV